MAKKQLTAEEKAAKKAKRKAQKEENEKKETVVLDGKDQVFINKKGEHVKLMEFIRPEEIWEIEKKNVEADKITVTKRYFILYDGIKRLAREAGIFFSDKIQVFAPTIENKDLYGFDVSVYCHAGKKELPDPKGAAECFHGFFKTTMLGEANDDNTKRLSGRYKGTTAEKRGFVRAVINHLGLKNIYGEDELDQEPREMPVTETIDRAEFEKLREILNSILNCEDKESLETLGTAIKEDAAKYSKEQLEYLRKVWNTRLAALEHTNF